MRFTAVLSALALVACAKPAPQKQPDGPVMSLSVDGLLQARFPITHRIPLRQLVPTIPAWLEVDGRASDGRYVTFVEPAKNYADLEIVLDVDHGRISLGAYPGQNPYLIGITDVEVYTRPLDPIATSELEIERAGKPPVTVSSEDLQEVPEQRPRPRVHGWALNDVIALAAREPATRVRVIGDGPPQTFTREDLAAKTTTILLKRNQRGELVLQVWGEGDDRARLQVRAVTKIVLDPRD